MKKRIVCVLLTLIMLVGLLPMSASAAGLSTSERAITVLKQLQDFNKGCTAYGTEWRTGYGTICTRSGDHATHTITEGNADKALRAKLEELDAAVNAAGFSLNQNQHDALVVFSYDCGTSWLGGTGVLKNAVSKGLTGNDFLNAIGQSSSYGSFTNAANVTGTQRRMIEANMYLNGAYSNVAPGNYGYVTYDANGGNMAEGNNGQYTQYFDSTQNAVPAPVPTKANNTFMGWYDGTIWVPHLYAYQVGKHLVAMWQPYGTTYSNAMTVDNYYDPGLLDSLYVYSTPSLSAATTSVVTAVVHVDRDYIDENGSRWSRVYGGSGWVLVEAGASAAPKFDIDVTVTVTNSTLNSRVNASIFSGINTVYKQGDQLRIVQTANGDGFLWGQVADGNGTAIGWVALMYTNWNAVKDNPAASNTNSDNAIIAEAVINCAGYLNVRSEAGTDNAIVGALADGDHVDVYEIKFVNGHQWGRISDGWILLTYAKVTMLDDDMNFTSTADVLAYTFTGTLKNAVTAHTDVSHNSDTVGKELAAGTVVAVSMVKNDESGNIWGYNGTGWIKLDNINMDVAKYVVVSDSVTVRASANSGSNGVEKIVKGVELDITEIAVVDATIWGKTEKYGGWVNLASKYVQRSNAPIIENAESVAQTGLVATVVNTDSVNVRTTGATYGDIIGSLARGTTVVVWDGSVEKGWYKLDTNQNGTFEENGDGWVSAKYLDVYWGTVGGDSEDSSTDNDTTTGTAAGTAAIETGLGIVVNTYSGVNVRTGAGTGYAATGKILNGTTVEILEVTSTATAKWGRTAKGWICMDYVTMVSKYAIGGTEAEATDPNAGQNAGGSTSNTEGNTTIVSTPAIYTGTVAAAADIKKTADADAISIGALSAGESVTIQELVKVTTKKTVEEGTVVDGNATTQTSTVVTSTTFWARVNGGWVADPASVLSLNPLDETTYTVVNYEEVNVRDAANGNTILTTLDKGTQVAVTSLQIVDDKVWGYIEDVGTSGGWVRLDNLSEGKITVKSENTSNNTGNNTNNTTNNSLSMGNTSNTGGYVTNASGYRYTGKIINTNEVNVRATPSTGAAINTTLKYGAALVVYETTIAENMAWGRCDAGWVYLYYVDLTPAVAGPVDARVVFNENTIIYTDANASGIAGTYARMSVIDIYEIVGTMARTDKGWVSTNDLL